MFHISWKKKEHHSLLALETSPVTRCQPAVSSLPGSRNPGVHLERVPSLAYYHDGWQCGHNAHRKRFSTDDVKDVLTDTGCFQTESSTLSVS